MIEEDFYASIKFKSGEEVFAKVLSTDEGGEKLLVVTNPVIIKEIRTRQGYGYKIEPWLKTSKEDLFVLDMNDILTMSESKDIKMIMMYQSWVRESEEFRHNPNNTRKKINRKMGYIANVNDAKEILERLFKDS